MNFFAPKTAAERYAQGRPDVHRHSIDQIRDYLRLQGKVDKALDIACGTGLSTKALLDIAQHVYGTDISPEMLHFAPYKDKIRYSLAPAEQQPFADNTFDLITVSSGVHWFDIERFIPEARRILKRRSWLVLYENYFDSSIQGAAGFGDWYGKVYLKEFPSPPRNTRYDWAGEKVKILGLNYVHELRSVYTIPLTRQQLVLYLTTQSNVISKVECGDRRYEEVRDWLDKELSPIYPLEYEPSPVSYGNWVKFLQRID